MRAFAWFAYLLTQAAQLTFIFFLQNWGPAGVDKGLLWPWPLALAWNLCLLLLFVLPHSVMARPAFKQKWTQLIPPELERSAYVLVAGISLLLLCLLWRPLPQAVWQVTHDAGRVAIYALFFAGLIIMSWAIAMLDTMHFMGVKQALRIPAAPAVFVVRGPYRWVRHPIQSGVILAVWATPEMSVGHLLFSLLITAYSIAATLRLEEPELVRAIGPEYIDYKTRVPALLPRSWRPLYRHKD